MLPKVGQRAYRCLVLNVTERNEDMRSKNQASYLEKIYKRYHKADRATKAKILDEFCEVCDYHRKHAIRLLKKQRRGKKIISKQKRGRKISYEAKELLIPLQRVWLASDQMCGKKLKAALPEWLPHYSAVYEPLTPQLENQLLTISAATIDRLLKPVRIRYRKQRCCGTRPGTLLKHQIPIKTDNWDVTLPGFLEADSVAHCGNSLAGDFVWSLTFTDILTTWTENRATWNKGAEGVKEQVYHVEKSLPFTLRGFDCDNGSEFLNWHLARYFTERHKPVQFTRSRPYRKNDNAHVEQKNWTTVRQLFGYERFDNSLLVELMNDLYANEWCLYYNHFCPTMKLIEKIKINSKYSKRYDAPKTPYQRVLDCPDIDDAVKQSLRHLHLSLNPFILKQQIQLKLNNIFKYVKVTSILRQRI